MMPGIRNFGTFRRFRARPYTFLAATSVVTCLAIEQVTAERSISVPVQLPNESLAPTGIRYDELVTVKVRDALFKVPAAYFQIWPTRQMIEGVHESPGLSFMFWVPELRPVLVKTVPPLVNPRPQEPGQRPPRFDEFTVVINFLQFVTPGDPNYLTPTKRFDNHARIASGPGDEFTPVYGLQEYRLARERIPLRYYRHSPGTEPEVVIRCDLKPETIPNPVCGGEFYFQADQMAFYSSFPQYALPRWREIALGTKELALRWRIPPKVQ